MRGIRSAIRAGDDFKDFSSRSAVQCIEIQVLKHLAEISGGGTYAYITPIAQDLGIDREYVRIALRSLRDIGFAVYARGLWSDSGEPAGAGYSITPAGRAALSHEVQS